MIRIPRNFLPAVLLFASIFVSLADAAESELAGAWTIDRDASSAIDPWSRIELDFQIDGDAITLTKRVSAGHRGNSQVYPLVVNKTAKVKINLWTGNRHIGAYIGGDGTEKMHTTWQDKGRTLQVVSRYTLRTSQGDTPVRSHFEYRLSPCGKELTVIELRSSRNQAMVQVFRRPE